MDIGSLTMKSSKSQRVDMPVINQTETARVMNADTHLVDNDLVNINEDGWNERIK